MTRKQVAKSFLDGITLAALAIAAICLWAGNAAAFPTPPPAIPCSGPPIPNTAAGACPAPPTDCTSMQLCLNTLVEITNDNEKQTYRICKCQAI